MREKITVSTIVEAPLLKVWEFWTLPMHILNWNNASADWHTTRAENDLQVNGKFLFRMEAKDGSMGFDMEGEYLTVNPTQIIEYSMSDGRTVKITFESINNQVLISETFEAESENSIELQQAGWQAILDNFKNYTEANF